MRGVQGGGGADGVRQNCRRAAFPICRISHHWRRCRLAKINLGGGFPPARFRDLRTNSQKISGFVLAVRVLGGVLMKTRSEGPIIGRHEAQAAGFGNSGSSGLEQTPTPGAGLPAFEKWLQGYRRRLEQLCEGANPVGVPAGKSNS
jgi:hypothetical protein